MEDTNNYYPLQQLGYREDYAITLQGEVVETANKQPIQKDKRERYKLTTADGKSVYRAIKPLYRRAFRRRGMEAYRPPRKVLHQQPRES